MSKSVKWNTLDTLFENLPENGSINIIIAEFGEDGIETIDFNSYAHKILDGKGMHVDVSVVEYPMHWILRDKLVSYLEQRPHEKYKYEQLKEPPVTYW